MPPVASTAAQAIFEGLHEDASRSGRTDARLCIRRAHTQHACACCACAGQHVRAGPWCIVTQPRCSCVNSGGCHL